jgi:AraC-like DNA-binding protein
LSEGAFEPLPISVPAEPIGRVRGSAHLRERCLGEWLIRSEVARTSVGLAIHPPRTVCSWHNHERPLLTLILAGGLDERIGASRLRCTSLMTIYRPPRVDHTIKVGPTGAVTLQVLPARECSESLDVEHPFIEQGGALVASLLAMARLVMGTGETEVGGPMVDQCLRQVRRTAGMSHSEASRTAARLLQRGLTVRETARRMGISPATLWRLFHSRVGVSPGRWQSRWLVSRAARQLTDTDERIAVIARDCGFADQSHFGRCVRRETGMTPRQIRQLARGLEGLSIRSYDAICTSGTREAPGSAVVWDRRSRDTRGKTR